MPTNRRVLSSTTPSKPKLIFLSLLLFSILNAETLDESLEGFDDEPTVTTSTKKVVEDELMEGFDDDSTPSTTSQPKVTQKKDTKNIKRAKFFSSPIEGMTGKLTEQTTFSYGDDAPHDNFSSLKSSLLLDYEHKFDNGFKVKTNAKAYYDAIYSLRGREKYSKDELDELESEVELFDAYVEGSLANNLDMKLGRQVVVWGRSDTIRITDILNPLDNRRPGMVDIEDLRLPVAMAKFDYFVGDWRVTPMAILEQRFSKNPPAGSAFNGRPQSLPTNEKYHDVTPALSVGAEFSGWDVNFYAAKVHDDVGYFSEGKMKHDKVNMFGTALNILNGSWLLKSELAHFDGLKYSTTGNKTFNRTDALVGLEYNGIADTLVSYDVSVRKIHNYDANIENTPFQTQENTYQHAFRVSSDFMNATVKANYLISLFGSKMDRGGFQRAWLKYDIADGIFANVGVVDYIGGSNRFDAISNNDMAFVDVTYSF